jgi:hypothetical protein
MLDYFFLQAREQSCLLSKPLLETEVLAIASLVATFLSCTIL